MSFTEQKRFTVISNNNFEENNKPKDFDKYRTYQTNPLREKMMKFVNNDGGHRFTVEDLLR